ncbi:MAG: DUF6473 family protein [Pikeienuella sp.]
MTYQKPDQALINYDVYQWGRLKQIYRGPQISFEQPYVACLGAAQTFGRYAKHPFPTLLGQALNMPCANFGTGGAGPGFFLRDSMVLEAASNAEVCIVQVMSARSLSNRMFQVKPKRNAQIKAVSNALSSLFPHMDFETFTYAHNMLNQISADDPEKFLAVERELKSAWVARTRLMLEAIHTKKILLWFSERQPDENMRHRPNKDMLKYPHYVDQAMIDEIAPSVDQIVYCVSSAGLPQSLLVKGDPVLQTPFGMPIRENRYYPSPEMHQLAADLLKSPISAMLPGRSAL